MKRLLTYGLLLLTILASHFVVSACQEDVPETTEVIMTFTTRALLTQNDANAEINAEQLRTLHVIMRKSDGTIYHASRQDIQENQVTVTFEDVPVSAGEEFEFFAIANQEGIMWNGTAYDVSNPTAEMLSNFPDLTIGNGSVYALTNYLIPQTKYWKEKIYPLETIKIGKQLDFAVGKISVQFVNETNSYQSLNTVKITGVKPNGYGYLFAPIEGGNRVEDYYPQDVNTEIGFENVNIQAGASSSIQHYYTYPIDAANITNPQFTAQWNGTHTLNLSELKELKRGQHLKIVVTLSGVGIQVAYNIVDWVENTTTIGGLNSTLGDNYFIAGWEDDDVVIGGEDEPEVPDPDPDPDPDPGTGREVTVWGEELGNSPITPEWANSYLDVQLSWFEDAKTVTFNNIEGIQMYVYFTGNGQMQIRNIETNSQYDGVYLNNRNYADGNIDNISSIGKKISVFIPNSVKDTPFRISGVNYTITKITVVK